MATFSASLPGAFIPAGSMLEARLVTPTGTRISKIGDRVEAVLMAPIAIDAVVLLPAGVKLEGIISHVKRLGLSFRNATASIEYSFHSLHLPGGKPGDNVPLQTQLILVDTAKEYVNDAGRVIGISPITNLSSSVATYAWRLLLVEPVVAGPVWLSKFIFARAPDPEIHFPAGTELLLRLTADLHLPENLQPSAPVRTLGSGLAGHLEQAMLTIPHQAAYQSGLPSDLINLVLVGRPEQLARAFAAAGWSKTDRKSARSLFRTYFSIVERRGYRSAPMNTFTLDGQQADLSYQKSLNSFSKRHHLRIWRRPGMLPGPEMAGLDVWVSAATEDVGIGFKAGQAKFKHIIDPHIDNERSKVVNDLVFTGCVDAVAMLERTLPSLNENPDVPITDGRLAVVQLNDCLEPRGVSPPAPKAGPKFERLLASMRDDFIRSNFLYLGYNATRLGSVMKHWIKRPSAASPRGHKLALQHHEWLDVNATPPDSVVE
ncbi:MAG: LssY C-terminal domain-containing protein [Acidobacteriia bacterium]|nr:LssY C-terminal domain-containing protein [Terriglobia bacterium]